jgi:hypothetical protein
MKPDWAVEHLQVIRTLMERSAIYRRALAPIMLLLGILGIIAAAIGLALRTESVVWFAWYWMSVSGIGVSGAYWMVRRQALKDAEPFWSPPTRRVTQAVLPPLLVGLVASVLIVTFAHDNPGQIGWLLTIWMTLYGCALHAAGFFTPRGMKLFGWGFILSGCTLAGTIAMTEKLVHLAYGHGIMGFFFGGLHLAYGIYLYFTEPKKNET